MLAVQVKLLTGRYVATRFNDRTRVEWPPHPARLFSAAVAAWADADEPDRAERAALSWWEEQGDPTVACSWGKDGWSERAAVVHFVPVNDTQVVGRDLSATYRQLRASIDTIAAARADSAGGVQALAQAERAAVKMLDKATRDSAKASSAGRAPASALGVLPDDRLRHRRVYPTAVPVDDGLVYRWPDADGDSPHVAVLDGLLARVGRLGHSSSFVAVSVGESEVPATLVADKGGRVGLRVASPGQLGALEAAYVSHQGCEPRVLPARVTFYREAGGSHDELPPAPVFASAWPVLELGELNVGGRSGFTVTDTLALARAVRGALMCHGDQDPVPEVISGHAPAVDGVVGGPTPATRRPHLAVVPLPFAGYAHADGRIRAVALVLPTALVAGEDGDRVRFAVRRWLVDGSGRLNLGVRGSVEIGLLDSLEAPASARPDRWCCRSRRWLSVTPVALDRNPGNLRHSDVVRRQTAEAAAGRIVAAACVNIGLPAPVHVAIHTDALVRGSAPVRSFPRYAVQGGGLQRVLVHAAVEFPAPVSGPVLLGAGRYQGYGLFLPARGYQAADSG